MPEEACWHSPASSASYIGGVFGSVNPGVVGRGRCALPRGKGNGADAFQRAVSRLLEMQGEAYIGLGHLVRETDLVEDPVTCTR